MSRKFSDSEIRAYSKNRYEEKLLRQRLDKLKESAGVFHDATAKQRQDLVVECKDIRMTTGGSQPPDGFVLDTTFDISKRVSRPWAYSVMETTYNAAYRDAVIPLPKRSRNGTRSRSGTSRGLLSRSSMCSNRIRSSKSYSPSIKSAQTTRSENILHGPPPNNMNRSVSYPEINNFKTKNHSIVMRINGNENPNQTEEANTVNKDTASTITCDDHSSKNFKDEMDGDTKTTNGNHLHVTETVTDIDTGDSVSYKPLEERNVDTRIITLPPMYKIDSKAYQDAERERAINRSRSRVSFSSFVGIHETKDDYRPKSKSSDTKRPPSDIRTSEHENKHEKSDSEKENKLLEESVADNNSNDKTTKTVHTIDPETLLDANVRKSEEVVYRGKRIRNYIKPEERYKLDPLVMKRRQNKMDKLAKESVSFLKRVNHENIRVEIAFPRSARKRILTKLVNENNSGRSKTVIDSNEPVIRRKIEYFMSSMSEYIHQQQLEREQYFQ